MRRPSGTSDNPALTSASGCKPSVVLAGKLDVARLRLTTPAMDRSNVDLPAPFGPMTAMISP